MPIFILTCRFRSSVILLIVIFLRPMTVGTSCVKDKYPFLCVCVCVFFSDFLFVFYSKFAKARSLNF